MWGASSWHPVKGKRFHANGDNSVPRNHRSAVIPSLCETGQGLPLKDGPAFTGSTCWIRRDTEKILIVPH